VNLLKGRNPLLVLAASESIVSPDQLQIFANEPLKAKVIGSGVIDGGVRGRVTHLAS